MTTPLITPVANNLHKMMRGIIYNCGLGASTALVLDAADPLSYDGSSQTWTDATGNGNDFYRGDTSGAAADDPAWTGTIGLPTEATYFSFDGGDQFSSVAAPSWDDNCHKDNGALWFGAIFYCIGSAAVQTIFQNAGTGTDGFNISIDASEVLTFQHSTDNTTAETVSSGLTVTADAWNFIGLSFNEATTVLNFQVNADVASPAVTASTCTDASGNGRIGSRTGGSSLPLASGTRIAALGAGAAHIGATGLSALYKAIKGRRSTSIA